MKDFEACSRSRLPAGPASRGAAGVSHDELRVAVRCDDAAAVRACVEELQMDGVVYEREGRLLLL